MTNLFNLTDQQYKAHLCSSIAGLKRMYIDANNVHVKNELLSSINDLKQILKSGRTDNIVRNSSRLITKHCYKLSAYIY